MDQELKIKELPKSLKTALLAMWQVREHGYGSVMAVFHQTKDDLVKCSIEMSLKDIINEER